MLCETSPIALTTPESAVPLDDNPYAPFFSSNPKDANPTDANPVYTKWPRWLVEEATAARQCVARLPQLAAGAFVLFFIHD